MSSQITRDGWTFSGWFTSDVGGTKYDESSYFGSLTSLTLYAHWSSNQFTLSYDNNGGIFSDSSPISFDSITYGTAFSDVPKPSCDINRDGYQFVGWSESSGKNASALQDSTAIKPADGNDNKTLYARWKPLTYTALYDANGGVFESGDSVIESEDTESGLPLMNANYPQETPTRDGFTFNGWWTTKSGGTGVSKDTIPSLPINATNQFTYYAHWLGNTVFVKFDAAGGTINGENQSIYSATCGRAIGTLPGTPTKEHFTFDGWYTEVDGGEKVTIQTICMSSNTIYYAHWTPKTYTVSFYDGYDQVSDTQYITYGSHASIPPNPESYYGDKVFDGWFMDETLTTPFDFNSLVPQNIKLYVKWRYPKCIVRFSGNGGKGQMPDVECDGERVKLPKNSFTKTGYLFDGWTDDPNDSYSYGSDGYFYPTASQDGTVVTLYALWSEDYDYWETIESTNYDFSNLNARSPVYGSNCVSGGLYDGFDWGLGDTDEFCFVTGAVVRVTIAGKVYSSKVKANGLFKIQIPKLANCKIGTKVKFTFSYKGKTRSIIKKIRSNHPSIKVSTIFRDTNKPTIIVRNVHKGDTITLKTAGKRYTKKVAKSAAKLVWKPRVATAKAGSRVAIRVANKYRQLLSHTTETVYYSKVVKLGMTKKQVHLVPGFEQPDKVSSNGAYSYYYYKWSRRYDYIHFYRGRVYKIVETEW